MSKPDYSPSALVDTVSSTGLESHDAGGLYHVQTTFEW